MVVEAALKRTQGDWGEATQRAAYDMLELTAKWQGHLLDDRPEALFSLLLEAISKRPPETPPLEQANNPLWFLEKMANESTARARVRDVRETIGAVAVRRPREVLDVIKIFLAEDTLETEEAIEMRAECVYLLGFVGKRSDFLAEVLPLLYAGLVHREQIIRAWAINGLIEIAKAQAPETIPVEFSATIPALLSDPYVIVHKRMMWAITRGVPVRDEHAGEVVRLLLALASHYAKTESDSDALDDALSGLLMLAAREDDPQTQFALNRIVGGLARKLEAYDLKHYLDRGSRSLLDVPEYVAALVDALQRPEIVGEPNSGDSRIREILSRVPPSLLAPHSTEIVAAAHVNLPLRTRGALEYVEVLQRLGLWDEAVKLSEDVVAAVPTTVDHAPERMYAERVCAWARLEAAVAGGGADVRRLLSEAVEATQNYARAKEKAKTEFPWPA